MNERPAWTRQVDEAQQLDSVTEALQRFLCGDERQALKWRFRRLETDLILAGQAPAGARLVDLNFDGDHVFFDFCADGCCPPLAGPTGAAGGGTSRAAQRAARPGTSGSRRNGTTTARTRSTRR